MASKPSHETLAMPSRRRPQNKRKRPAPASTANPLPSLSSPSVVNPPYASKAEIQEVVPELKNMKLDPLVMRLWTIKDQEMCKEFLDYHTGRRVYHGKHRLKTVEWDSSATFAKVYGVPAEGAVLADLEVNSAQEYFEGAPHDRKDGFFLSECTNDKLRKLLRVLNPILVPGRSNQVPHKIVAAVTKSWLAPDYKVNWAEILSGVFLKLSSGSDNKTYRCYLSPYLYHLYDESNLLTSDEEKHLKLPEQSYLKTGRDFSKDDPEVTSVADKFQANAVDLEDYPGHLEDGENIAVKASSNPAESAILSKEDHQGSNAHPFPQTTRESCEFRGPLQANACASLNHSETSEFQQRRTGTKLAVLPDPSTRSAFVNPGQSTEAGGRGIWHQSAGPSNGLVRDAETSVPKEPAIASSSRTQDCMGDPSIATSLQTQDEGTHRPNRGKNILKACEYIQRQTVLWDQEEESDRRRCRQERREKQELQARITQKEGEIAHLKDRDSILFQQVGNLQKQVGQLTEKLELAKQNSNRRQQILEQLRALPEEN